MTSAELERLAERGYLEHEPPGRAEVQGLLTTSRDRLRDAQRDDLSLASRFDLAYNAAHALALAALRLHGYRSKNRYIVFQALQHTLGIPPASWRIFAKCHEERNATEYEGISDVDETLVRDLIAATQELHELVAALPLPDASDN